MTAQTSRAADVAFGTQDDPGPVDAAPYLGTWVNTNLQTDRVRRLLVAAAEGGLTIRLWGADGQDTVDWGAVPAEAFACIEENGVRTAALFAEFDFGFMRTALQLRLNKGILPMMQFISFADDSGRSNYYAREFFRRAGPEEGTA